MVRVAFIGAGGIARQHLDTINAISDAESVAICDVDKTRATSVAAEYDAAVYTDYRRMFETESLDAVFVTIPPFAHAGEVETAVEYGLDVFVEKPVALTMQRAVETREAIAGSDSIVQVGYMNRYRETVERAMELIEGWNLALLDGSWYTGLPEKEWWQRKDRSGGQTVEMLTHMYDLLRYIAGEVTTVAAAGGSTLTDVVDFPDTTGVTFGHDSGTVSQVASTFPAPERESRLTMAGEGFRLELELGTYVDEALTLRGTVDGKSVELQEETDPYRREVEAFLEAVQTGDRSEVRSDYDDAVRSLAVSLAVNKAIEEGRVVHVKELLGEPSRSTE